MNVIKASTIDDAWRSAISLCVSKGKDFVVKGGSYKGQIRKQLEYVSIIIYNANIRPLSPILPPNIPGPTNEEKIEKYFQDYIFNSGTGNEQYTYGDFIKAQYEKVIYLLKESKGNTNQATIAIGDAGTTFLSDPPCLRCISFKVVDNKLNMTVYFRSWDLYCGLPENLGGLQLLKEMVLSDLQESINIEDGKIIAFSDGLHLYEQYFDLVNLLNIEKVTVTEKVVTDKVNFFNKNGL